MCRHCDRLVVDADAKQLVHDFMARMAANLKRDKGLNITADDIDIEVWLTGQAQVRLGLAPPPRVAPFGTRAFSVADRAFGERGGGSLSAFTPTSTQGAIPNGRP